MGYLEKVLTRGQDVRIGGCQGVCQGGVVPVVGHLMMRMMGMMHAGCHGGGSDCISSSNV